MENVTQILTALESGDGSAAAELLPLVYEELRKLAASRLAAEHPGHTLQATALVHEAYLRLVGGESARPWNGRGHFFAAAAESIRRILVDHARQKGRLKRGGDRQRIDLTVLDPSDRDAEVDLLALDDVLSQLAAEHPEKAKLVELRYFTGMTIAEAAAALGVSTATAERHWRYARAWLASRL